MLRATPVQHVADLQYAAGLSAEAAENERRSAAEVFGHVDAAANGDVCARSRSCRGVQPKFGTRRDFNSLPVRDGGAIQCRGHVRAGEGNVRIRMETQRRTGQRAFESGRGFRISHQSIRQAEGQRVHRTGRRHSDMPVPRAAGIILHGGLQARFEHLKRCRRVVHAAEKTGGKASGLKFFLRDDVTEIFEICFESSESARRERLLQCANGIFS